MKVVRLKKKVSEVKTKRESGEPAMFFAAVLTIIAIYFFITSIQNSTPEGFLDPKNFAASIVCLGLIALSAGAAEYFESGRKLELQVKLFTVAGILALLFPLTLLA